jgi:hypothetical protein
MPVNSFWDLGHSDYTSIWLHQHVWPWNHFLRYYQNSGEKLAHYAGWLQRKLAEKGAVMGTIYLPHDAASVHPEATHSYEEQIRKLFPGANVVVVERPNDKYYDGIELTREVSCRRAASIPRAATTASRRSTTTASSGTTCSGSGATSRCTIGRRTAPTPSSSSRAASSPARRRATSAARRRKQSSNGLRRDPMQIQLSEVQTKYHGRR